MEIGKSSQIVESDKSSLTVEAKSGKQVTAAQVSVQRRVGKGGKVARRGKGFKGRVDTPVDNDSTGAVDGSFTGGNDSKGDDDTSGGRRRRRSSRTGTVRRRRRRRTNSKGGDDTSGDNDSEGGDDTSGGKGGKGGKGGTGDTDSKGDDDTLPTPSPGGPGNCPPCLKTCSAYGDPHVAGFNRKTKHVWGIPIHGTGKVIGMVSTPQIKIQLLASPWGGWGSGIAVTGSFIGNNELILLGIPTGRANDRKYPTDTTRAVLLWNGKEITTSDDGRSGGSLGNGVRWTKWDKKKGSQTGHHTFGDHFMDWNINFPRDLNIRAAAGGNEGRVSPLIRMSDQGRMSGWCGNFQGPSQGGGDVSANRNMFSPYINTPSMAVPIRSSLLQGFSWLVEESVLEDPPVIEETNPFEIPCSEDLLQKAKTNCNHIIEEDIRQSCIEDICTTADIEESVSSSDDEVMMLKEANDEIRSMSVGSEGTGCKCP